MINCETVTNSGIAHLGHPIPKVPGIVITPFDRLLFRLHALCGITLCTWYSSPRKTMADVSMQRIAVHNAAGHYDVMRLRPAGPV